MTDTWMEYVSLSEGWSEHSRKPKCAIEISNSCTCRYVQLKICRIQTYWLEEKESQVRQGD